MAYENETKTVSRRDFLIGLGATLALPLIPGCGLIDQFEDPNCGALDCTSQPSLEVGRNFRERVERAADFIRELMSPEDRDFPILFQKSDSTQSGGLTQPGNTPLYSGPLVVRLFLPDTTEASAQLAERMIVHEAVHAYDISTGYNLSRSLSSGMERELGPRLDQAELSVFDESAYSNNPLYYNHGHPGASYAELFASTINVLQTYPEAFTERVNRLPTEKIERVSMVASICLGSLVEFAHEPTRIEGLPIDPTLVNFLSENL